MIILAAAALASGQALPWINRAWLAEQVRLEAASSNSKRPLKPAPQTRPARPAPAKADRTQVTYADTVGM